MPVGACAATFVEVIGGSPRNFIRYGSCNPTTSDVAIRIHHLQEYCAQQLCKPPTAVEGISILWRPTRRALRHCNIAIVDHGLGRRLRAFSRRAQAARRALIALN
jgi:hypothetical protein